MRATVREKKALVEYGFRLPSAFDNRPLCFEEFEERIHQVVFVSATPAQYERDHSAQIVEQVYSDRTGLLTRRLLSVRSSIRSTIWSRKLTNAPKKERVLVTTLTKRMAEDLTDYLRT